MEGKYVDFASTPGKCKFLLPATRSNWIWILDLAGVKEESPAGAAPAGRGRPARLAPLGG